MHFAPRHAPLAPPAAPAAAELLHALDGWQQLSTAGAKALAAGHAESLARALEARELLRSHIEEMLERLRSGNGLAPRLLREISSRADAAAAADAELLERMGEEQDRIRGEMDALRRGNDTAAAYLRPDAPAPHRLNIVR